MSAAKVEDSIRLSKERQEGFISALQYYFLQERDEELNHLGADLLFRFILRELGPDIYNQGVRDATGWLMQRIDDIAEIEIIKEGKSR